MAPETFDIPNTDGMPEAFPPRLQDLPDSDTLRLVFLTLRKAELRVERDAARRNCRLAAEKVWEFDLVDDVVDQTLMRMERHGFSTVERMLQRRPAWPGRVRRGLMRFGIFKTYALHRDLDAYLAETLKLLQCTCKLNHFEGFSDWRARHYQETRLASLPQDWHDVFETEWQNYQSRIGRGC